MDPDAPLLTAIRRSVDRAGVLAGAGSRYAPVAPLAGLMAELEAPGAILFIGKPCDVGALRQLMRADPAIAARFVLLLSFFCAGVPSQDGTTRIVERLGMAPEEVAAFRYRGDGWPGQATATAADGRTAGMSYEASWGEILSREIQWRCKICPDGVGGAADIAAADAWECDAAGYPLFEEGDGRSLLMARTAAGEAAVAESEAAGAISTAPFDPAGIGAMQPSQARRKRLIRSRLMAMALAGLPRPDVAGLAVDRAARGAGLAEEARAVSGSFRRIARRVW
jgi:coenzyme F420 hydrogenase subunit beta